MPSRGNFLLFLLLPSLLLALSGCGSSPEPMRVRSVVLISIDTLRADHLATYGYERDTSPHLDQFAADNVVFDRAYAPSFQTAESHMSVFTGLYPSVHRVYNGAAGRGGSLFPEIETLPQRFAAHSFQTAGFHGGGNVTGSIGFGRGFHTYEQVGTPDLAIEWLQERRRDQPFFLFFHTYRVHDPYVPDPPFDSFFYEGEKNFDSETFRKLRREQGGRAARDHFWSQFDTDDPNDVQELVDLYDAGVRQADHEIGQLLAAIEELAPRAIVIIMSDHGEEFGEHGGFLHGALWEELIHVPLMMRIPHMGDVAGRVPYAVNLIDLNPTILDLAGLPVFEHSQGRSLIPTIRGKREVHHEILSERLYPGQQREAYLDRNRAMIVDGWKKLVWDRDKNSYLFDLEIDPGEQHNLCCDHRFCMDKVHRMRWLTRENERHRRRLGIPRHEYIAEEVEVDEELREQLEALGYV
ncbi:MAG: sulfatase [Acidobacteriota bacterium]